MRTSGSVHGRLRLGLMGLVVAMLAVAARAQVRNVVMIVADDQRPDTIHALGNQRIATPNLDRLAAEGTAFTRMYCMGAETGAVCSPSRAMFLSGRSLFRIGPNPYALGDDVRLLPEVLRERGFTTFATGKWHNGKPSFTRSFGSGASIFFGGMGSHTDLPVHDFDPAGEYPDGRRRPIREFSSAAFASAAVGFLRSEAAREPFFLYLAFTAPHDPRTPPEDDLAPYAQDPPATPLNFLPVHPFDNGEMTIRDEQLAPWPRTEADVRRQLAEYYGMITHMDRQIGRVLDALLETGRSGDTLVVFFSDHGLAIGSHGLMGKQNLYEHSMGSPVIFAGPGVRSGVVCDAPGYLLDIPATVCDMLGVEASWCPESRSLAPALRGEPFEGRPLIFTAYRDVQRAVTDGRWKLIVYPKIDRSQLFDLASDPGERLDLSGKPEFGTRRDALWGQLRDMQAAFGDAAPLESDLPRPDAFDFEAAESMRQRK